MRVLFTIALLSFGVAQLSEANAGDHYFHHAHRAGMMWVVDKEPGVTIRAYWRAPWRHHHYFPVTGKRPRVGRHENLSARSHVQRAKSFERGWSNEWAFENERPRLLPVVAPRAPMPKPELK